MCQFYVCYSKIYNLYMYIHEIIRNQLIRYLILYLYRLIEIWKQPID